MGESMPQDCSVFSEQLDLFKSQFLFMEGEEDNDMLQNKGRALIWELTESCFLM